MSMRHSTVKWFDAKKGYGFIENPDGGGDVFVHYSQIDMEQDFKTLRTGQTVDFEMEDGPKGLHALNVSPREEEAEPSRDDFAPDHDGHLGHAPPASTTDGSAAPRQPEPAQPEPSIPAVSAGEPTAGTPEKRVREDGSATSREAPSQSGPPEASPPPDGDGVSSGAPSASDTGGPLA